ncbi:MAG: hypothetical protein FGM46_03805 [Ferruginibacter sp.]|nr:hypothetical protein [Ferruginibacter sp.]
MAIQTIPEKLQLKDEKNVLIQGLPSSIEKQFVKLNFSKSVTPLLRSRKVDFALIFAVSKTQLTNILNDIMPALNKNFKLWVAYPKPTAKIASDLCRHNHWQIIDDYKLASGEKIELDSVWCATNFLLAEKQNHLSANELAMADVESLILS